MNKFAKRLNDLRELMKNEGLDAFYINSAPNVAYFTGHKGDDCLLDINSSDASRITDFRYQGMAESCTWLKLCLLDSSHRLIDYLYSFDDKVLGIERDHLPLADYLTFKDIFPGKHLNPVSGLVEALREVKDEEEIAYTKKACEIATSAFEYMIGFIKPGMIDKDCAAELEYYMKKHGADGLSFDTILISGVKTSMPHGVPGTEVIHNNSFVTMDFGCKYQGYCSDMTRTFAFGSVTDEMKEVYNTVLKAQLAACEKIHAGITGKEADSIARDIITEAGYGPYFGHSLGHGTGLEIHELPRYSQANNKPIKENTIVSIEPGIYLPGKFGVRIEDLALVTINGIINFVTAPKDLLII
ncbi:MAG: aminopeptidase P family protein [Clostridia bacterium]|nr:aminopeptidase P family protein [Clostridia bacterium]